MTKLGVEGFLTLIEVANACNKVAKLVQATCGSWVHPRYNIRFVSYEYIQKIYCKYRSVEFRGF